MHRNANAMVALLLTACVSAPALDQSTKTFPEGVRLSYDGDHQEARREFLAYKKAHPDDLLSALRLDYDYLFDVNTSEGEYGSLLRDADAAIGIFEAEKRAGTPCSGTDLKGIAGDTLDCDYVGAALYSFRVAIRIKKDGKFADWKEDGEDDRQFFAYAVPSARAGCVQAEFLLAVHEYEASSARVLGAPLLVPWILKKKGIPVDRDDALRNLVASLRDKSPFADDVRFYILRIELEHKEGDQELEKKASPAALIAILQPKYPHNRMFEDSLDSFSDSFESR